MFPVKSEPSETCDVGKDSQRIRLMDDNQEDISDTLQINAPYNWPDKSISKDISLTVAYVKNESASNALDYNTSNCNKNERIHVHHVFYINVNKMKKTDACTDNKSGQGTAEDNDIMLVSKESKYYHIKEHDIKPVTDTSQHSRVGKGTAID